MRIKTSTAIAHIRQKLQQADEQEFFTIIYHFLYEAYLEARKHKTGTTDEALFEANLAENLYDLTRSIIDRTYRPSRGIAFIVTEPVIREIFAAPFRDRVVHHFIFNFVCEYWENHFIEDSYSCRVGKGTDYGIRRMYKKMRQVSRNFTEEAVVLKFDLQGYFMSLPRKYLYDITIKGLDRQFGTRDRLYWILRFLWSRVIFDDPTKGVEIRGSKTRWSKLPPSKSLFCQPRGRGIVIGNLTSQLLSNIYLNQLDWFVTRRLKIGTYGRYVDDFYFVVLASELPRFQQTVLPKIETYVDGLRLRLHPKKRYCQSIEKGVAFLGVRIYPHRILPDYRVRLSYHRALKEVVAGERNVESLVSFMGRLEHMDSRHFQAKLWREIGWDYKIANYGPWGQYFGL